MDRPSASNGRRLTDAEQKLWQHIARTIQPLHRRTDTPKAKPKPKPVAKSRPHIHLPPAPPRAHQPALHPIERRIDRRTRRGRVKIDSLIDLHDLTRDAAFDRLGRHLHHARARGHRCVLVITGKGRSGEGVLRQSLPTWLHTPDIRPLISGYAQAHIRHGGGGAFYVFLKRKG